MTDNPWPLTSAELDAQNAAHLRRWRVAIVAMSGAREVRAGEGLPRAIVLEHEDGSLMSYIATESLDG